MVTYAITSKPSSSPVSIDAPSSISSAGQDTTPIRTPGFRTPSWTTMTRSSSNSTPSTHRQQVLPRVAKPSAPSPCSLKSALSGSWRPARPRLLATRLDGRVLSWFDLPGTANPRLGVRTQGLSPHDRREVKHYQFPTRHRFATFTWNLQRDTRSPPAESRPGNPRPPVVLRHQLRRRESPAPPDQSASPPDPSTGTAFQKILRHHTSAYLNPCRPRVAT